MKGHAIAGLAFVIGGCLLVQGCGEPEIPSGPGVRSGYAWDALEARLDCPIDAVYLAATAAVSQLHLCVLREKQDGVAAELATLDAQRQCITIKLEAWPEAQTALTIRAGLFGDRNKSAVIFERILANLGEGPATARLPW
jgi:hypothetical protein